MANIRTHKDLDVWHLSLDFIKQIYKITESFPSDERFGLVSQMRRASISICSYIAEGAGRSSTKEFIYFLGISLGSISEIETQLEIACFLGFLKSSETELDLTKRLRTMILGLIKSLKLKCSKP